MTTRFCMLLVVSFMSASLTAHAVDVDKKEEEKRQEYRKKVAEKLAELNGSSWDVQIKSATGKGIFGGVDTLNFQDQKFSSEKALDAGWTSTNYTLTIPENEDAPIIWETMQTSPKAGIAFWRGEWNGETMSGVISHQVEDKNEEYSFTSSAMQRIPASSGEDGVVEKTISSPISQTPLVSGANISAIPETAPSEPKAQEAAKSAAPKKTSWFF